MRILGDYHKRLKTCAVRVNMNFNLSMASPWEMQIKNQLGKLSLAMPVEELVDQNRQENNIQLLPIDLAHIAYLR